MHIVTRKFTLCMELLRIKYIHTQIQNIKHTYTLTQSNPVNVRLLNLYLHLYNTVLLTNTNRHSFMCPSVYSPIQQIVFNFPSFSAPSFPPSPPFSHYPFLLSLILVVPIKPLFLWDFSGVLFYPCKFRSNAEVTTRVRQMSIKLPTPLRTKISVQCGLRYAHALPQN